MKHGQESALKDDFAAIYFYLHMVLHDFRLDLKDCAVVWAECSRLSRVCVKMCL